MAFFIMRFDFRNPAMSGTTMSERYRAGLEMAEWADRLGFVTLVLSEHHGSDDGYLPSTLPMAAAIAARTKNIRIRIGLTVAAFHDPLRLAEDATVVDNISGGRLDLVVGAGYLPSEFDMFGVPVKERVKRTVETIETLRAAWTGKPFEFRGRTVQVTPAPHTPGGPPLELGASSEPAARRAARLGIGLMATDAKTWEFYRDETIKLGRPDPGGYLSGTSGFVHLAEDVEAGWKEIAPFAMHETNAYGKWLAAGGPGMADAYRQVDTYDELRALGQYRVLTPDEYVAELKEREPLAIGLLHPLMGGIPPEIAWRALRLLEHEVIPRL